MKRPPAPHKPADIITAVCKAAGIDFGTLSGKGRHVRVCRAREACVVLLRKHTVLSYPDIARAMGKGSKQHASVMSMHNRAATPNDEREKILLEAELALEATFTPKEPA